MAYISDVGRCLAVAAVPFFEPGIVEKVAVAVGIASLTLAVRLLFPLPVSTSGFVTAI